MLLLTDLRGGSSKKGASNKRLRAIFLKLFEWVSMKKACFSVFLGMLISFPLWAADEPGESSDEASASAPSSYIDLKPPFVANYGGMPAGRLKYLKTDISLRVEAGGESAVMHHMPVIRHHLVMLLSKQGEDSVITMEGKELLRQAALEEVRKVIMIEEEEHKITDLLFNSFIVQR